MKDRIKCEMCGKIIDPLTVVILEQSWGNLYFCSEECLDDYKMAHWDVGWEGVDYEED